MGSLDMNKGSLYLLPCPIGGHPQQVLSKRSLALYTSLHVFAVERIRTTRRLLKSIDSSINIDHITFFELNKHTTEKEHREILNQLEQGNSVGMVSESGAPNIADPGSQLILKAHRERIPVIPIEGPTSIMQALMASGLNGQQFIFHGYLPIKEKFLKVSLSDIVQKLKKNNYTHIFIETPYRNERMFKQLLSLLPTNTKLCVATNISESTESILTQSISKWRQSPLPDIDKKPTVFLLGR